VRAHTDEDMLICPKCAVVIELFFNLKSARADEVIE
jgi:hypothetical protein